MTRRLRLLLVLTIAIATGFRDATAQETPAPTSITLHSATPTRPALAVKLLPDFMERIDTNAVVYLGMVKSEQNAFFGNRGLQEQIADWGTTPLDKLRDVKQFLTSREDGPLYYLDEAARCTHADWQLPIGRKPYYSMGLPSIQESRQFARILVAHGRIAMAQGDYDEALRDFRTSFALARHVSANETLVGTLVGIAIAGVTGDQLLTLIQQPDAPSLYWPLTQLPPQLVDLRSAMEAEMHGAELTMTKLQDLESPRTPDEWRETLFDLSEQMADWMSGRRIAMSRPALTAKVVRAYPAAKRALMQQGMSEDAVAAMPVAQVILLHELRLFRELRDDAAKSFFLPYPQAARGLQAADQAIAAQAQERQAVLQLAETFLPAVMSCRGAQVRCDRMLAALRVLEALRIHAAAHEGSLPEHLSDVTAVPVPEDPVTTAEFEYELQDGVAHLRSPTVNGQALNYEIRMSTDQK